MVFFGAPQALPAEEQVGKACDCALAMQEIMPELHRKWSHYDLPELTLRIGIHCGPAVIGSFGGPLRSDYTAIGPEVNLASRIQNAAQPGEILFSLAVRDYLKNADWESAGDFNLKGIAGKKSLYRFKKRNLTVA
jgi:adenylate cyclase